MPIDALSVLCAQLTRDLLAIAKFLFYTPCIRRPRWGGAAYWTIAIPFGTKKTRVVESPDGEKILRICIIPCSDFVNMLRGLISCRIIINCLDRIPACDGQTDGQTDILPRHSLRYAYASRGKSCLEGTLGGRQRW